MPQAKILLYGDIGYDWWNDIDNSATRFVADMDAALADDTIEEIFIHINSVGGDVHEGLAIFNAIKSSKKPTTTIIDGIAYSMGAEISLASDNVLIAKNGLFMLHCASGGARGNAKKFRDTAEMFDKYDNQLSLAIADKTGKTVDEVKATWFNGADHFFTAQEAIDAKLIDGLTESEADVPEGINNEMPLLQIAASLTSHLKPASKPSEAWYNKLLNRIKKDFSPSPEPQKPTPTPENLETMIIKNTQTALITALGAEPVDGDAVVNVVPTAEQIDELNTRLAAGATAQERVTALEADLATVRDSETALTAERDSWKAKAEEFGAKPGATPTPPSGGDDNDPPRALKPWEENAMNYLGND